MDNQEGQGVPEEIRRRRATHLKYYNKRYQTDMEFRIKETKRNADFIVNKYHSDPEYKERIKQANLARYHAKKEMANREV